MSKRLAVGTAVALLPVIATPGWADAAERAETFKNAGRYEVSAQYRRRTVRRSYPRAYMPYPYSDPYFPPAPYVPLDPAYRLRANFAGAVVVLD